MKEAPEGLDYGTANKYDHTPVNNNYKEKGKIEMGTHELPHTESLDAGLMRFIGKGSIDPYYADSKKNK